MTDAFDGDDATLSVILLAATLLIVAAAAPVLVEARPAREIPAPAVEENLSGPGAPGWDEVPAADVPLSAAPSGLPNYQQVSVRTVDVQAARSDGRLYVRMRWNDGDANTRIDGPRSFVDGAAVQIPVNTSTQPAIAMGSERNLVNVWYWHADGRTEELLAGGQGSTTSLSGEGLETYARHEDGKWTVVFSRPMTTETTNRTAITDDADLDVAFAVFNGSNMERAGRKSVSAWYYLPLGPGQSGAPFETLLWVIAGLAVVAVVLVTIQGVRRVRGESGGDES
jgi:complex iron-sulfur molybdoenzyme family reductase subunit gamma